MNASSHLAISAVNASKIGPKYCLPIDVSSQVEGGGEVLGVLALSDLNVKQRSEDVGGRVLLVGRRRFVRIA